MRLISLGMGIVAAIGLSACVSTTSEGPNAAPQNTARTNFDGPPSRAGFTTVVNRVEPVAERECRARTRGMNCDFKIVVDRRKDVPANAAQTLDESGRPIIIFTQALIDQTRNGDEIAFVMGHEAAHHIRGHLQQTQTNAMLGALILTGLVAASGGNASALQNATDIGMIVGSRSYSKQYELQADALGTVIAHNAGFDPVRGAMFFQRIPDPGDQFLGTHPPNAERIRTVQRVAGGL